MKGGLTCTVGAEQCEYFTSRHAKGHSIDSKVVAVRFTDVANTQLVLAVIDSDHLAIHVLISVFTLFCILRAGLYFVKLA
jgi:cephalosporin hydroxylase